MSNLVIKLVRENRQSFKMIPLGINNNYLLYAPLFVSDRQIKDIVIYSLGNVNYKIIKVDPSKVLKNIHKHISYYIEDILVQIWYINRKSLLIRPSQHERSVGVLAPFFLSATEIKHEVKKLISDNLYLQELPLPSPYLLNAHKYTTISSYSGEYFCYLNSNKYLILFDKNTRKGLYKIDNEKIILPEEAKASLKSTIKNLYKDWLESKIPDMVDKWTARMNIVDYEIRIEYTAGGWGFCDLTNRVIGLDSYVIGLNPLLGAFPVKCIEAVLLHELNHLFVEGHNKAFYQLMDQWWPEWRKWRLISEDIYMLRSGNY